MKINEDDVEFRLELDSVASRKSEYCNNLDLLIIVNLDLFRLLAKNTDYLRNYLRGLNT